MVELKGWDLKGDRPGPRPGLVQHQGEMHLHPSEQVRGYVEYCRNFHDAVGASGAAVEGCVLFTGSGSLTPYRSAPHDDLASRFPLFSADDPRPPVEFLARRLRRPDPAFAEAFERGRYRQNRQFVSQVADAIRDPDRSPFVLLDEQRRGFEYCAEYVEQLLRQKRGKLVVIVEGPPGSGKSVLAAHLWASLVKNPAIRGNVVFTTTSGCQKSNWKDLYDRTRSGSKGVVVPANQYNPGLTTKWLKQRKDAGNPATEEGWRENVAPFLQSDKNRSRDDAYDVSIVDEAHALIDPTAPAPDGVYPSGWVMAAGPQAWHIIRSSRVSVFLMDPAQSYRENETTTPESIEGWARELGATSVGRISLAGHQFRCGGSTEYVRWLETTLGLSSTGGPTDGWRDDATGRGFGFDAVDTPAALDEYLRDRIAEGRTGRLVASYARPWGTKDVAKPHILPDSQKDFNIPYTAGGQERRWSRIWNYAPNSDYTQFIQAPVGSPMHTDPLAEVGCPYVIRGFDFDHLGVLWLSDLVWRTDHWEADPEHVKETALKRTLSLANRGAGGTDPDLLLRLKQGYRILLTRAIKGLRIWFEDAETREYVLSRLPN